MIYHSWRVVFKWLNIVSDGRRPPFKKRTHCPTYVYYKSWWHWLDWSLILWVASHASRESTEWTDKPFGKLGPSSSSSCSTLSPSSIIIAPRIITSPAQLKPPKVHYLLLPLANPPTLKGELTSENPFSIQSKSLSPHVSSTFSSIACLYRRACFSKAIFHLGQVTCRSVQGYKRGISITRNKRILCILNTFSWLLGVNNKENGRSGIFLTTAEFRKILFWCAAATLRDDFHDKNLPRSKGQGINFVELPLFAAADFKLLPSIR